MSDGHGSAPGTPPGWAQNQPPPYVPPGQAPWTSPGAANPPSDEPAAATAQPGAPAGGTPQSPPEQTAPGRAGGGTPQDAPPQGPGYGQQSPPPPPPGQAYPPPQGQAYPPPPGQPYAPPSPGQPYPPGPYGGYGGYGPHGQGPGYGGQYGFRPPPQAPRPGIIPLRPLALGDILDGTIKLIRSNPKATLGLSAIAAAIGVLPLSIGQAVYYGSVGEIIADPDTLAAGRELPMGGVIAQFGGALMTLVIQFFLVTILTGMLTRVLGRAVFGGRITIGEAWRLTRGRLPALFGLALLTGLIALAPLVVVGGLLFLLIAGDGPGALIALVVILSVMGYIAYLVTVSTRFSLAAAAVVLERRGVVEAMRRSWRLVGTGFWRVLGILILTQLLVAMLGYILSLPVTIVSLVVSFGGQGTVAATVVTTVLLTVGGILSSMITYPVQAGVNGLLYTDLRMRAEAFDLVLQTAALDQQRLGWVPATADELWHPSHAAGGAGPHVPGSPAAP
ncbi:hypothetical protein ABZT47_06585 [Sphaerisporangium sp. NPDC005289]|uniref:DUF7544 domain-containing protein n=1 Tax=Sphaerisporangium sp. NPDC005289 TaxID=3155247 RepID=UPI0033B5B312